MLAAISHDLQTPIARLALRADLLDDPALRDKLHHDLHAMQHLVEQGIAYARSSHAVSEAERRIDLHALLDSLICDYGDAGRVVSLENRWREPVVTRPETLRRILANLVDNALKFGDDVRLGVETAPPNGVAILVSDRGPGIPEADLATVVQPFRRLEGSRSRDTGGSGLGLAIADQLARALGGTLCLENREGGGSRHGCRCRAGRDCQCAAARTGVTDTSRPTPSARTLPPPAACTPRRAGRPA